jgi:hypothetical protein
MTDLTDEELQRLAELESKATPGPWELGGPFPTVTVITCVDVGRGWPDPEPPIYEPVAFTHQAIDFDKPPPANSVSDAEVIAAARNALPRLLAELTRRRTQQRDLTDGQLTDIQIFGINYNKSGKDKDLLAFGRAVYDQGLVGELSRRRAEEAEAVRLLRGLVPAVKAFGEARYFEDEEEMEEAGKYITEMIEKATGYLSKLDNPSGARP